jgi:Txe/YoeB family toxin of Txe-Axe toxin-antitoxin module
MDKKDVEVAWSEAKRFMNRVTDWIERAKTDPYIEMGLRYPP